MSTTVLSTTSPDLSTVTALAAGVPALLRKAGRAMATWQEAAKKAHLAAVMGYTLPRNVRCDSWNPIETLNADPDYHGAKEGVIAALDDPRDVHPLHLAVGEHIRWLMGRANDAILADCRNTFGCDMNQVAEIEAAEKRAKKKYKIAESKILDQIAQLEREMTDQAEMAGPGMSRKRRDAIQLHSEQEAFIAAKASELSFSDAASASVTKRIGELKSSWIARGKDPAKFFSKSKKFKALMTERDHGSKEKKNCELDLQAFFDHHAHGASHSESAKVDKKELKLASKIIDGLSGYKQIQIVDTYCMARGNELWAIIPDLIRIGHDIDPIECIHYKPPLVLDIPEPLRSYRSAQNKAFATTLLNLCDPGLRAKLLARHQHGASKTEYKADEKDGCALYWTLLQLYHPLSRQHRRDLEKELYAYPSKFASGNPNTTLDAMQKKHQEAMDISLKLRWDDIGIPMIDVLSTRDPLFAVELSSYRDQPHDLDDSAVVLDDMLSKVGTTIAILDTAKKDWETRSAKSVRQTESKLENALQQIAEMKKAMRADTPHNRPSNHLNDNSAPPGMCQVVKCKNKVQGYSSQNKWKICGTCLLKVRSTDKPVTLRSGDTWGTARAAVNQLVHRVEKGGAPKNCPNLKALKAQAHELKDDPASRKAKRAEAKAAKAAKAKAKRDREDDIDTSDDEGLPRAKFARTNPNNDVSPASQLFSKLKRKAKRAKLAKLPCDRSGSR